MRDSYLPQITRVAIIARSTKVAIEMTIYSGTARLVEILASLIREIRALWRYDPLVDDHRASEPFAREHVTLITKFGQV